MIRRIRDLLYDQGFTISGARNRLQELSHVERENAAPMLDASDGAEGGAEHGYLAASSVDVGAVLDLIAVRRELLEIKALLS
jgi:hypothetical protein